MSNIIRFSDSMSCLAENISKMSETSWQPAKYLVEFKRVLQKCPNIHAC
jgi:hypothetical protein